MHVLCDIYVIFMVNKDVMDGSEDENIQVHDDFENNDTNLVLGLPLAAILCIGIVIYAFAVIICLFVRQVLLKRRPLDTLESLHCCECLLLWPRPSLQCLRLPCWRSSKHDVLPWRLRLETLWTRLPAINCRLPEPPRPYSWLAGCGAWRSQCPTSVRCCGLEIRRDKRAHGLTTPGMVDAAISGVDVRDHLSVLVHSATLPAAPTRSAPPELRSPPVQPPPELRSPPVQPPQPLSPPLHHSQLHSPTLHHSQLRSPTLHHSQPRSLHHSQRSACPSDSHLLLPSREPVLDGAQASPSTVKTTLPRAGRVTSVTPVAQSAQ